MPTKRSPVSGDERVDATFHVYGVQTRIKGRQGHETYVLVHVRFDVIRPADGRYNQLTQQRQDGREGGVSKGS